jgi:hypothetical protein
MNMVPAIVAERPQQPLVVFSTGNVSPARPSIAAARENGCPKGRICTIVPGPERVFEYFSQHHGLRCLLFRQLCRGPAVRRAGGYRAQGHLGLPVELSVPAFNVIWQRDANSYALRCLEYCAAPPRALNITGRETLRVRAAAEYFAARWERPCRFAGEEGPVRGERRRLAVVDARGDDPDGRDGPVGNQPRRGVGVEAGGESLNKPTHFEVADGRF